MPILEFDTMDILCNEIRNAPIMEDCSDECVKDLRTIVYVVYRYFLGSKACKDVYCDGIISTNDTLLIDFRIKAYFNQLVIDRDNECNDLLCRYIDKRDVSEKMCSNIFLSIVSKNTYKDKCINSFKIVSKPSIAACIDKQSDCIDLDTSSFDFDIIIKIELKYESKN